MKKLLVALFAMSSLYAVNAQSAKDLFSSTETKVTWLGVDLSHIKLIGNFSQFKDAGEANPVEIKEKYFPAWNKLVINEPKKYDVKGMLRRDDLSYDIDQMLELNSKAPAKDMEATNAPNYKQEDIAKFVKEYNLSGKNGIGIAFVAESFNKGAEEAIIHFVAINMSTKEILIYEKFTGKPKGFGIKNYWAGAIFDVMDRIKDKKYKEWKGKYAK